MGKIDAYEYLREDVEEEAYIICKQLRKLSMPIKEKLQELLAQNPLTEGTDEELGETREIEVGFELHDGED